MVSERPDGKIQGFKETSKQLSTLPLFYVLYINSQYYTHETSYSISR
jgi:hypothetical protein